MSQIEHWHSVVSLLFDLVSRCKGMNGMILNSEAFKKMNPIEVMLKKKDHNFLHFVRKILKEDPRILEKAKLTALDKVHIHESFKGLKVNSPSSPVQQQLIPILKEEVNS